MVVFALEWENKRAPEYMRVVKERMSWSNITTMSSMGRLFLRGNVAQAKGLYVVEVEPLVPRLYLLPPIFSIGLFIFGLSSLWLHLPLWGIAMIGYLLWLPSFHVWAIKRGYQRQMGEKPVVRYVTADVALRKVVGWDK